MSMIRCDNCEHLIDSDDDPDCFVDVPFAEMVGRKATLEVLCENCRQNAAEAAWERQQEGEPPTTDRERYETAWHEHQKAHRR